MIQSKDMSYYCSGCGKEIDNVMITHKGSRVEIQCKKCGRSVS